MSKKHKLEKPEEVRDLEYLRTQREKEIDATIEKASQIKDPAEKLLALEQVKQSMYKMALNRDPQKRPNLVKGLIYFVACCTPVGLIAVASLLTISGIGKFKKRHAHLHRLEDKKKRISKIMDSVIENNVGEICQSPSYGAAIELKSVREKFKTAALKYVVNQATPAAEAAFDNSAQKTRQNTVLPALSYR